MKTARERLDLHRANPVCAGCHKLTDPIGLALENFDGAGEYRATERGAAIDASGELDGRHFEDVAGSSQAVHDHPQLSRLPREARLRLGDRRRHATLRTPMLDWLGAAVRRRRLPAAGPAAHGRAEQRLFDVREALPEQRQRPRPRRIPRTNARQEERPS